MEQKPSPVDNELLDLGFHSSVQRRGLVKWINGILAVVLFISLSGNIVQWRSANDKEIRHTKDIIEAQRKTDELNEKYLDVFVKMVERQSKTEQKVDTALILLNSTKQ